MRETNSLLGKDILSAAQLTRDDVSLTMKVARHFEGCLERGERLDNAARLILATLFFEPSTRTRLSFEAAMLRLGGQVISVADPKTSSAAKGESLGDTIRTVQNYADLIVIRHPRVGAVEEAAQAAAVPVINAGDGAGQHPTQALLDIYTILKEKGRLEGLTVALAGDLKNGRTVHSLAELLALYEAELYLVAPQALKMPAEIAERQQAKGVRITETEDLVEAIAASDILYMTRIQRERFENPTEYDRLKGTYTLDLDLVERARPGLTVMHPLPRVDEITSEVDGYEGAAYFRQAANGVFVRMALLALITGRVTLPPSG